MPQGRILVFEDDIKDHLAAAKRIAVLGLSPKPQRDSHKVGLYLKKHGYIVIPVRPA